MNHTTIVCSAMLIAISGPLAAQDAAWLPNHGQWPDHVRAAIRHGAMTTWLTATGWVTRAVDTPAAPSPRADCGPTAPLPLRDAASVVVELPGAAGSVEFGVVLPGTMAFFVDEDPRRWAKSVPRFAVATWREAWPGIDLVFTMRDGQLCYDVHVAPGADVDAVQLRFPDDLPLTIGASGVEVTTACGTLRHGAPIAWQGGGDLSRTPVAARFVARAARTLGFAVEGRDPSRVLVIDPPLQWLALHGGTGPERLSSQRCLARSPSGEIALCGATSSYNFPTPTPAPSSGGLDGFVSVFAPDGTLLWSAIVGGSSGLDFHRACLWDGQGGVVFAGSSSSGAPGAYPTTPGALQSACAGPFGHSATGDMVFGRLHHSGGSVALTWATFLGGAGHEQANGIAQTPTGGIAVAGWTDSATMPANGFQTSLAGSFDSYVAVLDPSASGASQFVHGSYLGGGATDFAAGIAVDGAGRVFVGGASDSYGSTAHPVRNALQANHGGLTDGVVAVFDGTMSVLLYGTYLGGSGIDSAQEVVLDAQGNLFVADWTAGFPFAMPPGAMIPTPTTGTNGYVLRLAWSLPPPRQLTWGTYSGGFFAMGINGLAVDAAGRVTVTGAISGLPPRHTYGATPWALQPVFVGGPGGGNGHWDAFVMRLDPERSGADQLVYFTFLGGAGYDYGYDLVLDERARAVVAGPTGSSSLLGQGAVGGGDVFLAHIDLLPSVCDRHGAPSPACNGAFADVYHRWATQGMLELTVTLTAAAPGGLAMLAFGAPNAAGTPVLLPTALMAHVSLSSALVLLGPFTVDPAGRADHHLLVPVVGPSSTPPFGISAQWFTLGGCTPWTASDAIRL